MFIYIHTNHFDFLLKQGRANWIDDSYYRNMPKYQYHYSYFGNIYLAEVILSLPYKSLNLPLDDEFTLLAEWLRS